MGSTFTTAGYIWPFEYSQEPTIDQTRKVDIAFGGPSLTHRRHTRRQVMSHLTHQSHQHQPLRAIDNL